MNPQRDALGVYVHIPFCAHRCHYCDFNTYEGLDAIHGPYVDAVVGQIEQWRARLAPVAGRRVDSLPPASTVFFGGGTPTLLAPESLARILRSIRGSVGVTPDAEVTVEANPETVDEGVFTKLLEAGFNRFSVGIQATSNALLARLGRTHSAGTALDALRAARDSGARNVNADLIYGSPWEKEADWWRALHAVADAGVAHVSAYALTIEDGTPLSRYVATGKVAPVDPDVQAARYEMAAEVLGAAGFGRYETSNWAVAGRRCRHNLIYWSGGNYLAFGAGAHGHVDGVRWWYTRLPRDYMDANEREDAGVAGMERLTSDERAAEAFALALRLDHGLDVASFEARFGGEWLAARGAALEELEQGGWVERSAETLRLADRAVFLADAVVAHLL